MVLRMVEGLMVEGSFQSIPNGTCFFFSKCFFLKKNIKKKIYFKKKMSIVGHAPKVTPQPPNLQPS